MGTHVRPHSGSVYPIAPILRKIVLVMNTSIHEMLP